MFKNFIRTTMRSLSKNKAYFFINILGLAIGLASFIFITLFVIHELSYDRFHKNHDRIYRIKIVGQMSGQDLNEPLSCAPLAATLVKDFPEVENVVRIRSSGDFLIRYKEKAFNETGILFADSTFFDIFSFKLIEGDPNKALVNPKSMVMTQSYAKKYFGDEYPIGKMIKVESDTVFYTVTGIVEDVPENSHFHFDMLASLNTLRVSLSNVWVSNSFYTYLRLKKGTNIPKFEEKLQSIVRTYIGPQVKEILGIDLDEFEEMGNSFGYYLQALTNIHLKSNLGTELEANGNIAHVNIFSIIGVFILCIAIINFINLSTAKSASRSKEVGIKKTIGSTKGLLIRQFLGESLLLTFFAILIAILLVIILTPDFNTMIGYELRFGLFKNIYGMPLLILLFIFVGLLAGIYPAFVMASFKPILVLKGGLGQGIKSGLIRKVLVVFQFLISICIIIGTIVVYKQLNYMQTKDIGFDKENLLIIQRPDALRNHIESFKTDLLKNSSIYDVANSRSIPGKKAYDQNAFFKEDDPNKNLYLLIQNYVSFEYPKTMGFTLLKGRFFDQSYGTDSLAVIINETAVKVLGLEDPIGKKLQIPTQDNQWINLPIIGILKDYHVESLHRKIGPVALTVLRGYPEGYISIRFDKNKTKETIEYAEQLWNSYSIAVPFTYFIFKSDYNNLYQSELKTSKIFSIFAMLAIFIASLGLLGLITYTAETRTKEIGIRKTHGASIGSIIRLLSSEIVILVIIASVIAWPIAYFGTNYWLNEFANRIPTNWLFYLMGTIITLIISWIVISYQTIKVALSNPVDSLRYE